MRVRAAIRKLKWVLAAYALLGVALWPVPLLNILHVESAAAVAFIAFFAAGTLSVRLFREGRGVGRVLVWQEAALVVPWTLLTITLLWVPNCGYLAGLLFYLLFPVVTVVLAVMLAYTLSGMPLEHPRRWLIGVGVAVAVLGPIYDLGFHPQFYTYNHVFGGILGPIYDRELALRPGLFAFRGLTLLWALFFFLAGRWLRTRKQWRDRHRAAHAEDRGSRIEDGEAGKKKKAILYPLSSILESHRYGIGIAAAACAIALCYAFSARLGINTPAWYLQERLGGRLRTEHFDIYYDSEALTDEELQLLAEDHEYRYAWLEERLDMEGPERIISYLYPDPETKARLTGARYTNVAPVWLPAPQVHVLQGRYDESFGHELVHVFSRAFGLPVLNASVSVGLVEGLAVALEPPDGRPSPDEQVSAALLAESATPSSLAEGVAARLSPFGFWTGRAAVSYTTMGAFVRYLIARYGVQRFKQAYAWADFEAVYGVPVRVLAEEWERALLDLPLVARATGPLVQQRFAVPSLFEMRCPHYVPPALRAYRRAAEALAAGDTTQALGRLEDALARRPDFTAARVARARIHLARGKPAAVVAALAEVPAAQRSAAWAVALGDAYALLGREAAARRYYERAMERLPLYAQETLALLALRKQVAARPAVVRVLAGPGKSEHQARSLLAHPDTSTAVRLLAAERLLDAGRSEPAARLLRSTAVPPQVEAPFEQALLARQRHAWLARAAYRRGAFRAGAGHARRVARALRVAGAFNAAAYFTDLADKIAWVGWRGRSRTTAAAI